MVMISKYRLEYNQEEETYYVMSEEKAICPICGCPHMRSKGRRKRGIIKESGDKALLIIRRLKCCDCKKTHHELPSIVVPYKRHCAGTITKAIKKTGASCEESTIRRIRSWWSAMQIYVSGIIASLKAKYQVEISAKKLPEIVRALANAHLWPGTRSAFSLGHP